MADATQPPAGSFKPLSESEKWEPAWQLALMEAEKRRDWRLLDELLQRLNVSDEQLAVFCALWLNEPSTRKRRASVSRELGVPERHLERIAALRFRIRNDQGGKVPQVSYASAWDALFRFHTRTGRTRYSWPDREGKRKKYGGMTEPAALQLMADEIGVNVPTAKKILEMTEPYGSFLSARIFSDPPEQS